MYFFTHLFISKILYKNFKNESGLSKWAFAYGNIKPDLPPACFKTSHTLEKSLFIVRDFSNQLSDETLSKKEFSVKMGQVCHFVCDFFCYYHSNETLHKKLLRHLLYEIRLHIGIHLLRFRRKFEIAQNARVPDKSIASMLVELRKEYLLNPVDIKRDITFALEAAACTFKSILSCRQSLFSTETSPNEDQVLLAHSTSNCI